MLVLGAAIGVGATVAVRDSGVAGRITESAVDGITDLIPREHKPRVVILEGKYQVPTEYILRQVDSFISKSKDGTGYKFGIYAPEEEADFVKGAYKSRCVEEQGRLRDTEFGTKQHFELWKRIVNGSDTVPVMDDGTVGYIARRHHFERTER